MAISNLINDDGEPRRASRRRRVMLSARLVMPTGYCDVIIRDVSVSGARIEGDKLPAEGCTVMLRRGTFSTYGRLVWVNGNAGGVTWDEPFEEDALMEALKGLGGRPQQPEPVLRRPGFSRGGEGPRFSDGSGWVDRPNPR